MKIIQQVEKKYCNYHICIVSMHAHHVSFISVLFAHLRNRSVVKKEGDIRVTKNYIIYIVC